MAEQIFKKRRGGTFEKRCKHFDGIDFTEPEKRCKAGVLMSDALVQVGYKYRSGDGGPVYTAGYSGPCFKDDDPLGVCKCEHQSFPTAEECREHDEQMNELIGRTFKARRAIVEATGGKRGVAGEIDCPVCGAGKLRYTVAESNGHVWGNCTTKECVSWME